MPDSWWQCIEKKTESITLKNNLEWLQFIEDKDIQRWTSRARVQNYFDVL